MFVIFFKPLKFSSHSITLSHQSVAQDQGQIIRAAARTSTGGESPRHSSTPSQPNAIGLRRLLNRDKIVGFFSFEQKKQALNDK
jgi:hypothetical protein